MKRLLFCFIWITIFTSGYGQNPIIQTNYTADAASLVYNDRFYIYAGRDEASADGNWYDMREWRVYSSDDMVNWTDHGAALRPTDFSWASGDAWAGECIYYNGKFYWYITAHHRELGTKAICVAVSDNPTGPFVPVRETPLITSEMTPTTGRFGFDEIDPTVFIDDDARLPDGQVQAYLYWGNGTCKYVKLNDDMISFSGEIVYVDIPQFGEAPWLNKINDLYYLSYSSNSPSTIEYATGPTATGPWEHKGRILELVENCTTSHQAITKFKGKWYLVYHNGTLPGGGSFRRSVCIEEFTFNPDGSIPLIKPTREGVLNGVGILNPFTRVEAETIAWAEGLTTGYDSNTGVYVTSVNNGDYIKVRDVDFGRGARSFKASVASASSGGQIEIRLGGLDGTLLGTCEVDNTGGWHTWKETNTRVKRVRGVHDVYFVFKGDDGELFNFDWWRFQ